MSYPITPRAERLVESYLTFSLWAMRYALCDYSLRSNQPRVNSNVACLHRQKPLRSRDSTPSAAVLASDRTPRTVEYASACPSLCAVRLRRNALWPFFLDIGMQH